MEGGPPMFSPGSTSPNLLKGLRQHSGTGLSPSSARHSNASLVRCRIRVRSPLLTESLLLSFPVSTEMFQFPTFAPPRLCIQRGVTLTGRVAPFGNPRIAARLPAPLGLSQVPTSFIASQRQDIHRAPLVA